MRYAVYGMRLKGDTEVRYVGQTVGSLENRLKGHLFSSRPMPRPTAFAKWIIENIASIEIFQIDGTETREEARKREREIVTVCLAIGHRLFNLHLVPAEKRIPQWEESVAA